MKPKPIQTLKAITLPIFKFSNQHQISSLSSPIHNLDYPPASKSAIAFSNSVPSVIIIASVNSYPYIPKHLYLNIHIKPITALRVRISNAATTPASFDMELAASGFTPWLYITAVSCPYNPSDFTGISYCLLDGFAAILLLFRSFRCWTLPIILLAVLVLNFNQLDCLRPCTVALFGLPLNFPVSPQPFCRRQVGNHSNAAPKAPEQAELILRLVQASLAVSVGREQGHRWVWWCLCPFQQIFNDPFFRF